MKITECQSFVHLAMSIQTDATTLNKVFHKREYNIFKIPKKQKGKWRTIEDPKGDLELVQRRLAKELNQVYEPFLLPSIHGYIPKAICNGASRDIFSNASAHLNHDFLLNVDLKDFFHSITRSMIQERLIEYYSIMPSIASYIAKIATYKKRLPMGSPLSPVLSNMMSLKFDENLESIAKESNLVYTRYVDDITFSGAYDFKNKLLAVLDKEIVKFSYERNKKKISYYQKSEYSAVTGLLLYPDGTLYPQKELLDSIRENITTIFFKANIPKLYSFRDTIENNQKKV